MYLFRIAGMGEVAANPIVGSRIHVPVHHTIDFNDVVDMRIPIHREKNFIGAFRQNLSNLDGVIHCAGTSERLMREHNHWLMGTG